MNPKIFKYYAKGIARNILPSSAYGYLHDIGLKYKGGLRKDAKSNAIARYGHFDIDQMRQVLESVGLRRGGILLVQISFNRFYNFSGSAKDILLLLEELVGPEGTLIMPAFPRHLVDGPFIFDVRKSPAQTGLLCELFRRRQGVIRSLNPIHSVCAIGPMAEELLSEHHLEPYTCGNKSPFVKLTEHGGQILGLGLPPCYTTLLHAVEDIEPDKYTRAIYVKPPIEYTVIDNAGKELSVSVLLRNAKVTSTMRLDRFAEHLSKDAQRVFSIHGVPAFVADAKVLLEESFQLRDRGITLYD